MQELKSLGRYLVKNKRCVLTYARQTSDETLQVHVDSDWAGDLLGRKSTTGVIVRRGKHLLRHMSCLQTLVALSSGEAEYYALIRGACTSLGIPSHHQDWMIDVPIQIYSDSSAARSVARRRGIGGRLRHLKTRFLWLQSRVALGHLKMDVVAGERNPADTHTKPLPGHKIREWSEHVGQRWLQQSQQQQQGSDRCAFPLFVRPVVRAQWSTCRCMATTAVGQRSGVVTVGCACSGRTSSLRCRWPWQQPFITAVMLGPCRTKLYGARGLPGQGSGGASRTTRWRPGFPPLPRRSSSASTRKSPAEDGQGRSRTLRRR